MLVFSRKAGQKFTAFNEQTGEFLGEFTIIETHKGYSRIGIEAPDGVKIYRNELLENPPQDKRRAKAR